LVPVVVDTAPLRCAPVNAQDRREVGKSTADQLLAAKPIGEMTKAEARRLDDQREIDNVRKDGTIKRLVRQIDKCTSDKSLKVASR
jgi:hypothetical protein